MNKILLIIGREYLTRVRKKSFIVMTILGPLIFAGIIIVPIWIAASDVSEEKVIAIIDESGLLNDKVQKEAEESIDNIKYEQLTLSIDVAKVDLPYSHRYGLLYIPADLDIQKPEGITFYSETSPSIALLGNIEHMLERNFKDIKLERSGISKGAMDSLETNVNLKTINLTGEGEQKGDSGLATAVGYIGAFLIYGFIFLYGAQVMRGVIEEKSNRIVEIIISSVRPFQLMTGKIIGVALVGLTQFMLWVIFTFVIAGIAMSVMHVDDLRNLPQSQISAQLQPAQMEQAEAMNDVVDALSTINIPGILLAFVFYFLGGYLLYAALFAAVGSASDTDTDSQQFTLPISAPLIFSIIILTAVLQDPNGTLAIWTSMIPFTSPIIMMMRIPFGVPVWQLAMSMLLLIGGFILTTWVASRIYRVGILIHGTKISYRTLGKWLFSNR